MKPTETIQPKAQKRRWPRERLREHAAALPRRVWAVCGAAALILAATLFLLVPAQRETAPPSGAAGAGGPDGTSPAAAALADAGIPEQELAFIEAVRLQPPRPTRLDSLQAEVVAAPNAPKKLVYTYRWKVNDRVIPEAAGDTLILSPFKKGDLVSVTVTPHDGSIDGLAVESALVAVHSPAPSLELAAVRQTRKPGEPIELQLVGTAPDGDRIAFGLDPPRLPGMTVDSRSGKISWSLQPDQKGSFRFGASVEDDQGTKVTKIFDITVE